MSSVVLSLTGFYGVSDATPERLPTFFWLAWASVPIVVVGALAEIVMTFSDRAAGRLPYLESRCGWERLGAAVLEVVVISYLLWTGGGIRDIGEIARETASFVALRAAGSGIDVGCARVMVESQGFECGGEAPRGASPDTRLYGF